MKEALYALRLNAGLRPGALEPLEPFLFARGTKELEMQRAQMQVKLATLTAEARIIRRKERALRRRGRRQDADSLRDHRRFRVRRAARHNHLAYGCMRGVPYAAMEGKSRKVPDWNEVMSVVKRFGARGEAASARYRDWLEAARRKAE